MLPSFILDTNIIIAHVSGREHLHIAPFEAGFSTMTEFELYALSGMSPSEEYAIFDMLNFMQRIPLSSHIAKNAGRLARTRGKSRSKDIIIIAATALDLGIPLVTKNTKDFRDISGLTVHETLHI